MSYNTRQKPVSFVDRITMHHFEKMTRNYFYIS